MPKIRITDASGLVQSAGSGFQVEPNIHIGAGLVTDRTAVVTFSSNPGVQMRTGVSGSNLDFPLEITGSEGSQCACAILLHGTGSTGQTGGLGTDVGLQQTISDGACFIFFDSAVNKLKFKVGSSIKTITSS